jgi:hypothetical protein
VTDLAEFPSISDFETDFLDFGGLWTTRLFFSYGREEAKFLLFFPYEQISRLPDRIDNLPIFI